MSPYRQNALPIEQPPKKKPWLCRIGLHFWGGWALDGCGVFFCMRCDKHFITNKQPDPSWTYGQMLISRRPIEVSGRRCENTWKLSGACNAQASYLVQIEHEGTSYVLCEYCMSQTMADEGPDVRVRPLTPRTA